MPKDDRDVFGDFLSDPDTPIEIDLFAYTLYVFEKYQWFEQFGREHTRAPDQVEIDRWVADITPRRFMNMREQAARLFDSGARKYLSAEIEAEKEAAVRSSILREIKAAGGFWRQMTIALATAIMAPIIIGCVIAAALTYDRMGPTATAVWHLLEGRQGPAPVGPPPYAH